MVLTFSDGMSFNTEGDFRIEVRSDGLYLVGNGMLIPINNWDEGQELIRKLISNKN